MFEPSSFPRRHIGPRPEQSEAMLKILGCSSQEQFLNEVIPHEIRSQFSPSFFDEPVSEAQALRELKELLQHNRSYDCYLGMGYYPAHLPSVIQRNVLENPGWYTAYTPYQAEISQGRMESLVNFQTMVVDLSGLPLANASLLDEGTAAAEAAHMALQISKNKNDLVLLDENLHPHVIAVIETRMKALGVKLWIGPAEQMDFAQAPKACILAYPDTFGEIKDYQNLVQKAHASGALVIVDTDLLALTLLTPPGEWGADIVVGNTQRFGLPLWGGGPHAAFLATRDEYKRLLPGRLVGVSVDRQGRPAYRLTLQTREQHIRREKATSNICTAQVLLANVAAMYAVYHGPEGLKNIALEIHNKTKKLSQALQTLGLSSQQSYFFDTLSFSHPQAAKLAESAQAQGILIRYTATKSLLTIALDETKTYEELKKLVSTLAAALSQGGAKLQEALAVLQDSASLQPLDWPEKLQRKSAYLTHPHFNRYHSETELLRYIKSLEEKDISLTRSMISLGSCTMKLNATSELLPLTWPTVSTIHPFAPTESLRGFIDLVSSLEKMLSHITGFARVSFQPNSGAQGEYAGLLTIRRYHESRGESHRKVCLIPSSAHGTNPASAAMAGFEVVVVSCDNQGNIDIEDLQQKAQKHAHELAALMVTYPSTHGVFEWHIQKVCAIIHRHGGQVYMDGANLNALVGWVKPTDLGADVAHMNLHKTFAIPHGGGGPGVGPIGVKEHLAPFLPHHPMQPKAGPETGCGAVTSAPWGSVSLLTISWMYIRMMGMKGLKQATYQALLSANYLAHRLHPFFPVLYKGQNGRVAHECILDLRPLRELGIEVVDVAKRLMDYGYHAPTMSWPVAGTLMVEPTESESLEELDRFIQAMQLIHEECQKVHRGEWPKEDNPVVNSPHTLQEILREDWSHPYSRKQAVTPIAWVAERKYWPQVARVNDAYGDRNVFCTCPPVEDWKI